MLKTVARYNQREVSLIQQSVSYMIAASLVIRLPCTYVYLLTILER